MRVVMIGAGYVGLVSGACFADFGHTVTCVDKDERKIDKLRQGVMPIYEPGLSALVETNIREGRLAFSTDLTSAIDQADVVFIAVGTPSRAEDGHADLQYVYAAAREVGSLIKRFTVVVTKSTVPVGTADEVERVIRAANPSAPFAVASNPEFLREGAAIHDFKHPDRVVVGTNDTRARDVLAEVYRPLFLNRSPVMFTDRRTAELIKYAANAFLATKISFINDMADLCEAVGANVQDVARGMGSDNRIGSKFLHAGPGYGGSCFPKDTLALIKTAQDSTAPQRIIEAVVAINDQRKRAMGRRIITACGGSVRDKRIAVLGLTFKPNTDDTRDAPAISIIRTLIDAGAIVVAHDPKGVEHFRATYPDIEYATDPYTCATGASAVAIVTEWEIYRALDLDRLKAVMADPLLVDLRNIYTIAEVKRKGLRYVGIGRTQDPAL